jgi:hypothetical protein
MHYRNKANAKQTEDSYYENEEFAILLQLSVKFVPTNQPDNKPTLSHLFKNYRFTTIQNPGRFLLYLLKSCNRQQNFLTKTKKTTHRQPKIIHLKTKERSLCLF